MAPSKMKKKKKTAAKRTAIKASGKVSESTAGSAVPHLLSVDELVKSTGRDAAANQDLMAAIGNPEIMPESIKLYHGLPPTPTQLYVKSAHYLEYVPRLSLHSEDNRHLTILQYDPSLTVGALKLLLQASNLWIPKSNLMLLPVGWKTRSPLVDDGATLRECGVHGGDQLLAFMEDGSFPVVIYDLALRRLLRCTMKSTCSQTIADLKRRIHQRRGYPSQDQLLSLCADPTPLPDHALLATVGIVKPYSKSMMKGISHDLVLRVAGRVRRGMRRR